MRISFSHLGLHLTVLSTLGIIACGSESDQFEQFLDTIGPVQLVNIDPHRFNGKNPIGLLRNENQACTAFVSNHGYVLTAGHCVADSDDVTQASNKNLTIFFQNRNDEAATPFAVTSVLSWGNSTSEDPNFPKGDWALLETRDRELLRNRYGVIPVDTSDPVSDLWNYIDSVDVAKVDPPVAFSYPSAVVNMPSTYQSLQKLLDQLFLQKPDIDFAQQAKIKANLFDQSHVYLNSTSLIPGNSGAPVIRAGRAVGIVVGKWSLIVPAADGTIADISELGYIATWLPRLYHSTLHEHLD